MPDFYLFTFVFFLVHELCRLKILLEMHTISLKVILHFYTTDLSINKISR